ncbi:MAG: oligosaccharide flippase family protein [Desulfobacteraceae bacterium]|nr:oligosaccharide flippase family protein [Desulfobacteraceae bacterium]
MSNYISSEKTGLNIASQWCTHITAIVVNFFLIGYVVGKLGPEHYGGWTTIISLIGYMSILSAGMSVAVQYYVAHFLAKKEEEKLVSLFSSSCIIYGLGAIIATLLCLYFSFIFHTVFPKVPEKAAQECGIALRWVAGAMFLFMMNMPIQGSLFGLQRHYVRNVIEILGLISRAVTVVILFILFKPSLAYLGVAFFAGICVRFLLCRTALWWIKPELRFRPSMINKDALRQIFSYGGHSFIWTICVVIARDSAPILAAIIISPEAATFWYVGNRVVVAIGGLVKGAGQVFVPVASSLHASGKWDALRSVLIRSTRFCALFGLSGAVALIMFGRDLINFWVGPDYSISYYVLVITVLGWVASWIFSAAEAILIGTRKLWVLTNILLFRLIAGILLSIIMASIWGILGLTAGLVIPTAISSGLFIPHFASKICKVKVGKLLMLALPAPLGVCLIILLSITLIQKIIPAANIGIFITQTSIAIAIFGILALLFGLDTASRNILLDKIGMRGTNLK